MKADQQIIDTNSSVNEIVKSDFRTAEVFQFNEIDYCCAGNISLRQACENQGISTELMLAQLEDAKKQYVLPGSVDFSSWKLDFLADYIVNVHHQYLKKNLPFIKAQLRHVVGVHSNDFPYLKEVEELFLSMKKEIFPHMFQEEDIYFPYVKQIAHAYNSHETYASLLVRTLRKPIENIMLMEHEKVGEKIDRIGNLTSGFSCPHEASISHRVVIQKLQELHQDLEQHIYLENTFLYPVAITMERELLNR